MTHSIWIPDQTPPQLDEKAARIIAGRLNDEGVPKIAQQALEALQSQDESLGIYLDILGSDLNDVASEPWPNTTLKLGAAIAMAAYRITGYTETVDDQALQIGHFAAELGGIPNTYSASLPEDPKLLMLTRAALEDAIFDESGMLAAHRYGYAQVFDIGAGCTRHFLQQAIVI